MMNRRQFAGAIAQTAISLTGLLGLGVGLVSVVRCRRQAVAQLVNNAKGCWFNGNSDCVCEGEGALLYEPEYLKGHALHRWRADIDQLVKDGYAEYL